ncbi:Ank2 [Symbiodinium microadriaticum]|nr:Ank2 [Symbiodinium sp. KB8]CAE7845770.1 Ank2 [Symbiodinium microadriaticum]
MRPAKTRRFLHICLDRALSFPLFLREQFQPLVLPRKCSNVSGIGFLSETSRSQSRHGNDWAAEKSQQELERSQAAEKAQKEEEEKRRQKEQRYREKQRELLLEWNRQKMDKLEEQRLAEQMEEEKEAAEAAKKQSSDPSGIRNIGAEDPGCLASVARILCYTRLKRAQIARLCSYCPMQGQALPAGITMPGATNCAKRDRCFPMWVIHADDVLELSELQPHQQLLAAGKLQEYEHGFVTFVSHEWSGVDHPDPENHQLRSLQRMLHAIRKNKMTLASDTISLVRLGLTRSVSTKDLKKISRGWLWIDFACVPQACCCKNADELAEQQRQLKDAVMSLHTYVAQSSFFAVLAPAQNHENGRLMNYMSWKRRGWCQFELAVNVLLGTNPVLHIASKNIARHMHVKVLSHLSPCCGDFTREEDRQFVGEALSHVIDCLASDLRATHNLHKLQLLDCMRTKLLQCPHGSPEDNSSKVNAALSSRTTFFHSMPQRLNSGWTHLHYAVARNDLYMIKNLLKARANVNTKTLGADKDFFLRPALSPLHIWSCFAISPAIAEILVEHRANVDSTADFGWTPLMLSCHQGGELACRTLLDLKANPNSKHGSVIPPLFLAASEDQLSVVELLLEARADVNVRWAGMSALHVMAAMSTAVTLPRLLQAGLDLNEPCNVKFRTRSGFLMAFSALWDRDVRRDMPKVRGGTPLVFAAARGNTAALTVLLEAGADITIPNRQGKLVQEVPLCVDGVCNDDLEDREVRCWYDMPPQNKSKSGHKATESGGSFIASHDV